jgi:hypothetical protein
LRFPVLPMPSPSQQHAIAAFMQATFMDELPEIGNPVAQAIYETLLHRKKNPEAESVVPVVFEPNFVSVLPEFPETERGDGVVRLMEDPVQQFVERNESEMSRCQWLCGEIRRLLRMKIPEKAAECVCVLREFCLRYKVDDRVFNDLLTDLIVDFRESKDLWKYLASREVSLIVGDEYSEEDAQITKFSINNLSI